MFFVHIAVKEFFPVLEVHQAQLREDMECIAFGCFEKAEDASKGVGSPRKATCFFCRESKTLFECLLDFSLSELALVYEPCEVFEFGVSDLVGAVERKGEGQDKGHVGRARRKGVKVLDLACKGNKGVQGHHH
jgi:hypothetical protein